MKRDQFKACILELEAPEETHPSKLLYLAPFIGVAFCLIKLALM